MSARLPSFVMVCAVLAAAAAPIAAADIVPPLLRGEDTRSWVAEGEAQSPAAPSPRRAAPTSPLLDVLQKARAARAKLSAKDRDDLALGQLEAALRLASSHFGALRIKATSYPGLDSALLAQRIDQAERDWHERAAPLLEVLRSKAKDPDRQALRSRLEALLDSADATAIWGVGLPVHRPRLMPRGLQDGIRITPSYAQGDEASTSPEDRAAGIEAVLSAAVRQKAASLGNDYIAIFDFVRSTIRTEWRAGSAQGVEETLRRGVGNDVEQASLLIALLRASAAPARYVTGIVEMPLADLANQLGVPELRVGAALAAAGIAHEPTIEGGRIAGFRIEHVWVSAEIPYRNYRGTAASSAEPTWLPLMPALKPAVLQSADSALALSSQPMATWIDNHLADSPEASPWLTYRQWLTELAAAATPARSLDDFGSRQRIDAEPLGLIPSSTPYRVVAVMGESAELLDTQRQWLRVEVLDAASGDSRMDHRLALSSLASRRFSLGYLPATVEDQAIAAARGGWGAFPAYLVRVRPTLFVGGDTAAPGQGEAAPGELQRLRLTLMGPAGEVQVEQWVKAGTFASWSLDLGGGLQIDDSPSADPAEPRAATLPARLAERYQYEWSQAEEESATLFDLRLLRPLPSVALMLPQYRSEGMDGLVEHFVFEGVALDAAARPVEPLSISDRRNDEADWLQLLALHGSDLEAAVFEELWGVQALSADRAFRLAARQGIALLDLEPGDSTDVLADHPATVRQRIGELLGEGFTVRVPVRPIGVEQWTGSAWRAQDPESGESGYFLSGGYAGGVTVIPPGLWYFRDLAEALEDPYALPVNDDPLSGFLVQIDVDSQRQIADAGIELPHPLRVAVTDRNGLPVQGASVLFRVQGAGNGQLWADAQQGTEVLVQTDRRGQASVAFITPTRGTGLDGGLYYREGQTYPDRVYTTLIEAVVQTRDGPLTPGEPFTAFMAPGPVARITLEQRLGNDNRRSAGLGWEGYRVEAFDQYDNPVANHAVVVSTSDQFTGPSCSANFEQPGSSVFLSGDCPTDGTSLLTGHSCARASVQGTTRHDGFSVNVVPGAVISTRITVTATSEAGSASHTLLTTGSGISVDDEGRCVTQPTAAWLNYTRRDAEEIGLLGQPLLNPRRIEFYTQPGGVGVVSNHWTPTNPASLNVQVAGGTLQGTRNTAAGRYLVDVQAGNTPSRITMSMSASLPLANGESRAVSGQLFPAWALDLGAPTYEPEVSLDPFQALTVPIEVNAAIRPEAYQPVDLTYELRDEEGTLRHFCYFDGAAAESACVLPRGLILPANRQHHLRYVIHPQSNQPQASAQRDLDPNRPIIAGFGGLDGSDAPPDLNEFVARRYPGLIEVRSEIDIQTGYLCAVGTRMLIALGRPAALTVSFHALDRDGEPEREVWRPRDAESLEEGVHTLEIAPEDLGFGEYEYRIEARAGDTLETRTGRFRHREQRRDALSLSTALVKGVNLYTGGAVVSEQDVSLGGRGPGLSFTRTYASHLGDDKTVLGRGWHSDLDSQVLRDSCGSYVVTGAAGQGQRFVPDGTDDEGQPRFRSPNGFHSTFRTLQSGYELIAIDGTRYHFAELDGGVTRLSSVEDANGNRVTYDYAFRSGQKVVTRVRDDAGRALNFEYESKTLTRRSGRFEINETRLLLTRMLAPGDLRVSYAYDNDGNLREVRRHGVVGGETRQGYRYIDLKGLWLQDPSGENKFHHFGFRLSEARNEIDGTKRSYTWELGWNGIERNGQADVLGPEQRVATLTEPDGGVVRFAYAGIRGVGTGETIVTDALLNDTRYLMNRWGGVEELQDPVGTTLTTWDLLHLKPASVTDAEGRTTHSSYDAQGNLQLERIESPHGTLTRSFSYVDPDEFVRPIKNRLRRAVDARGIETVHAYDHRGNRIGQSRGGVNESWEYTPRGEVYAYTNGAEEREEYRYDPYGYRTEARDLIGIRWRHVYDVRGRRVEESDGRGHITRYVYDDLDRRVSVSHPEVTVPEGGRVRHAESWTYDDASREVTHTDARGVSNLTRMDSMGRVVREIQARFRPGQRIRGIGYDFNGNRTSETDWAGQETIFVYDAANRLIRREAPLQQLTVYTHDAVGNLLSETLSDERAGAGSAPPPRVTEYRYEHPLYKPTRIARVAAEGELVTLREYDENGNLTTEVDANGHRSEHDYDERDRRVLSRLPERRVETAAHDDADRLVSTTLQDAEGDSTGFIPQTRSRQYDVRGRVVVEVDAEEGRTRLAYDRSDNLVSRTDPTSGTWAYAYDERNRLVEERGPEAGQLTTHQLDPNGNRTLTTTPDGRELHTQYDEHNRPVSRSDQLGQVETLTYTLRDELRRRTDGLGRVTRHDYDALGRETLRELPAVEAGARTLRWGFNALGDLLEETDAGGHVTSHGYDGFGRRISTRGPGVPENPAGHLVRLVLDGNGNPVQRTDARGVVTTTRFDGLNRPENEQVELAAERYTQSWSHDVAGNLLEHVDRAGESTLQTFDRENRVLTQRRKSATGALVTLDVTTARNRYDAAGRLRFVTDALDEVTEYRYDRAGRRTHELRPLGFQRLWTYTPFDAVATYRDADGILTTYRHDVRQRLIEEEDAHGGITLHGYDAVGNRTSTRRPAQTGDVQWEFGFDAADRLASVTSPEGHRTAYAYDPDGNRTHIDDANRHITRFDYDALHRLQQTTFADLTRQTREYDGNGNLLVLHHEGRRVESRYDALNREVQRSLVAGPDDYVDDEQPIGVLSSYDGNGRLIRQTQQRPAGDLALTRAWDALGRLVDESDWHAQPTSWTYDAVGTRTRRSDLGGDTLYQADRLHRVSQLSPPGAASLALEYTPEGRIAAVHHGDVASALYGYDALGRLEQLTHTQTSVEVARWDLTLDANGNREAEQLTTPDGIRETTYRYDEDDRLTGITSPETDTEYTLDPVGNRVKQQVMDRATAQPAEDVTYTYNARDQLETTQDATSGESVEYAYDAQGNLSQISDANGVDEYRHNVEDRLATLTLQGAPPVRYRYGPDGLRIAKLEGASETRFGYDQGQLRREHNVLGNLTEAYEHHAGLVLHQQRSAPTQRIALLHDTQRSPVRFVQQDGATAGTRRFDAWGEVREEGGAPTRVGYTGYYSDAESGQYYAQQRYYRQGIGRFTRVDLWEGDTNNPITLNKYLYANGNPLLYVDPDGRCGIASSLPSFSAICAPIEAHILGINLGTEAGQRQLGDYRRGTRQGAWESAKETAAGLFQFAADLSVSGRERLTGENFGASDRLGATVAGMVETFSDPSGALATYAADRTDAIAAARAAEDFEGVGNYVSRTQLEVGSGLTGAAGAARTAVVTGGRLAGRLAPDLDDAAPVVIHEDSNSLSTATKPARAANGTYSTIQTPWGRQVAQRSDVDWDFERPTGVRHAGLTNQEAAELGFAPVRINPSTGKIDALTLHHLNKEPGGSIAEVWSTTHNRRHRSDSLTARGLNKTVYDPLLGWRSSNPQWSAWWKVEQSVYWRWSRGDYVPPDGGVPTPPPIKPDLP